MHNLSSHQYGSECLAFWKEKIMTNSTIYAAHAGDLNTSFMTSSSGMTKTNDIDSSADLPFKMKPAADIFWTVIFSVMLVCAISGNLVVFWIVLGKWYHRLFCRYMAMESH